MFRVLKWYEGAITIEHWMKMEAVEKNAAITQYNEYMQREKKKAVRSEAQSIISKMRGK